MSRTCFKYRLYPSRSQETKLEEALGVCRGLYNSFLHDRKFAYEVDGRASTQYEQEKKIAQWKSVHPELATVHAHLLQDVARRVHLAYQAYFDRLEDYQERKAQGRLKIKNGEIEKGPEPPRKKGKGVYDSLTWKEYGNGNKVEPNAVVLSKIGTVKAVIHRPLNGIPKTLTVRRQGGKWFACVSCIVEAEPLPVSLDEVGVDVGIEKFASLSTGEFIANPRFFRTDQKALAKAQRKFDKVKHQHRSQKRRKAKKVITRLHERIRNRRHDFHHQTARQLVNRFGVIAVEALDVSNMSASPAPKLDALRELRREFLPNGHAAKAGLNKSILDAGWYGFRQIVSYKAESAGRIYVEVNPAYTSQDCSGCGYRAKKPLWERWHQCPVCGLSLDRDTNAGNNILQKSRGATRRGRSIDLEAAGL
jgi:putative transposase